MKRTITGILIGFAVAFAMTANSHTPCVAPEIEEYKPMCKYMNYYDYETGQYEYKYICDYTQ